MNTNLNNKEINTLISIMKEELLKIGVSLCNDEDVNLESVNKKIEFFNKILDKLGVPKETPNDSDEKICERCGITEGKKGDEGYPISVNYYDYAKQTLCDCCIDIFNGDTWGYNRLKELFGAEQAKKMLTAGFNEVPFGFKISRVIYSITGGNPDSLEFLKEISDKLNSELK